MTETTTEELQPIEVAANTMLGDLMHCVIEQVKALPKSWQQLSEQEQDDYLNRVEAQCRSAVRQAVHIIASENRTTINATVESVTFKDGVKAVLKMLSSAEGRHELADSEGEVVQVVIMRTDHLTSDNGKPQSDKQQGEIPLGDGNDGGDPPADGDLREVAENGAAVH